MSRSCSTTRSRCSPAPGSTSSLDGLSREVDGLGPLDPLLADPEVTEIMVDGPGRAYVERAGRLVAVDLGSMRGHRSARGADRRAARSAPRPVVAHADTRLADGSRVDPCSHRSRPTGPASRSAASRRVLSASTGWLGTEAGAFLRWAVAAGWNLLVAGATSAGKTTLLNALSGAIPARGSSRSRRPPSCGSASARGAVGGASCERRRAGGVSVRDLVRSALRMRPDRIVVGEVRGGEALDMLQALNTGHDGSLSTSMRTARRRVGGSRRWFCSRGPASRSPR